MPPKAIITGIAGQDGSYLAEWLLQQGYELHGIDCLRGTSQPAGIGSLADRICWHDVNLLDGSALAGLLERVRPDEFYNLAAMSFVPDSATQPVAAAETNGLAVLRILEAIRKVNPAIRFFQAGSSQCFGDPTSTPQDETTPFRPRNPYAAAKAYAHWITANYRDMYGLFACCGILFNHESPRRSPQFVTRKISLGAAGIRLGLASELRLGNLRARRDWGYAGDFVQAMWRMLQLERPQDFVIGTGIARTVQDFVALAFARVGLDWRDHVVVDPLSQRRDEGSVVVADATKARTVLNWEPTMPFEALVAMMVEADLRQLSLQTPQGARDQDQAAAVRESGGSRIERHRAA